MNARIGLRLGGLTAAVACAFLAACGGGGGGGGSTLPVTTQSSPTPTAAPTIAPTTQATSAPLSTTGTTQVQFGGISNGTTNEVASAIVTLPAANTAANVSMSLTATAPSGVTAPQGRLIHVKHPDALGIQSVIAYFAVQFSQTVTITQTPAFSITLPGVATGNWYVLSLDPSGQLSTGWQEVAPLTVSSNGTMLTLAAATVAPPLTLQAKQTYYFAIASTGANPIQTPTAAPTATPTTSAGATPNPSGTVVPGTGTPLAGPTYGPSAYGAGWGPLAVASSLDMPVQHGWDGTGVKVAIVIDSCVSQSDWSSYFTFFNVPNNPLSRLSCTAVDGASSTPSADPGEAALDSETIASLAPGATVTLYVVPSLAAMYLDDAYAKAIADGNQVVNMSYGGCEYTGMTADTTIAGGAANGVAFVASAGDQGNECYKGANTFVVGVEQPASDPNVIGVGGTETQRTANELTSTIVWNDTSCVNGSTPTQCAGGGGISTHIAIPTYQTSSNVQSGAKSSTFRNVPDISFPGEYDAEYVNGGWGIVNGTSWSAPIAASLFASLYQYCGTSIANPVNVPYIVYNHSQYGTGGAFIDVTSGNNGYNGTAGYTAAAGYDNASGIGVPMGMTFVNTVCPGRSGVRTSGQPAYRAASYMQHGRPVDVTFDPRPAVSGLTDLGARSANVMTPVQVLIRPTSSIASDEQNVIDTLRSAGFTITQTFPNHLVVDAEGPASLVNRFFNTNMREVDQRGYGERYAAMSQATIPAAISPYASQVHLSNVVTAFVPLHH